MRPFVVILHRWFGLFAATFLFIAGTTGAVISWDHELDAWLNPEFFEAGPAPQGAQALAPLALVRHIESADPRVRVTSFALSIEPGHTFGAQVAPKLNPLTGKLHQIDYNQIALNPVTGQIQAKREWGKVSLSRENLIPFLYKLHYSMHVPEAFGLDLGSLFMGLLAIVWVLDTLIALWISFPNRRQWRRSFAFRWREGGHRFVFDLHRSGAMWVYALVLMLAVTSVSMNLREQVMRPVVGLFADLSPSPFATRVPVSPEQAIEPRLSRERMVEIAHDEARKRGMALPVGALWQSVEYDLWGAGYYLPGNGNGQGEGLGNPWIYFDAGNGQVVWADIPGAGTAGDTFLQSMFPLHSGRIVGMPGRILISLMGVLVASFSVTGVLIWARKRRARLRVQAGRHRPVSPASPMESQSDACVRFSGRPAD